MQPSQQHVASYVKWVEWGLGTRGLGIVTPFWAYNQVEVAQEAGVVPSCRRAAIRTPFYELLLYNAPQTNG